MLNSISNIKGRYSNYPPFNELIGYLISAIYRSFSTLRKLLLVQLLLVGHQGGLAMHSPDMVLLLPDSY